MLIGIKNEKKEYRGSCSEETLILSGNVSHTWTCKTSEGEKYSARASDTLILRCNLCGEEFTLGRKAFKRTLLLYSDTDMCSYCRCKETSMKRYGVSSPNMLGRRKKDSAKTRSRVFAVEKRYEDGPSSLKRKTHSYEELCKLRSENAKKLNADPVYKKKLSDVWKKKWKEDKEFLEKHKKAHEAAMRSPKVREKISKASHEMWKNEDYRKKMSQHRYRISKFQKAVFDFYKKKDSNWELEKPIKGTYYTADLYNESTREIIECYGDYWHCNPKRFNETFYHKHTHRTAKETWSFDAARTKALEVLGYEVKIIWESDWKEA
jgi:hypothetical protein